MSSNLNTQPKVKPHQTQSDNFNRCLKSVETAKINLLLKPTAGNIAFFKKMLNFVLINEMYSTYINQLSENDKADFDSFKSETSKSVKYLPLVIQEPTGKTELLEKVSEVKPDWFSITENDEKIAEISIIKDKKITIIKPDNIEKKVRDGSNDCYILTKNDWNWNATPEAKLKIMQITFDFIQDCVKSGLYEIAGKKSYAYGLMSLYFSNTVKPTDPNRKDFKSKDFKAKGRKTNPPKPKDPTDSKSPPKPEDDKRDESLSKLSV